MSLPVAVRSGCPGLRAVMVRWRGRVLLLVLLLLLRTGACDRAEAGSREAGGNTTGASSRSRASTSTKASSRSGR